MATELTAIDLETANSDSSSICQIGIVHYRDDELDREWMSYINPRDGNPRDGNPRDGFNPINVSIHGITPRKVCSCPQLPEVAQQPAEMLDGRIVVSHTHFDRVVLDKAFEKHGIPRLNCQWLDSAMIARRAWAGLREDGAMGEPICAGYWGIAISITMRWATPKRRAWPCVPPLNKRK